jgi:hypothetical protein
VVALGWAIGCGGKAAQEPGGSASDASPPARDATVDASPSDAPVRSVDAPGTALDSTVLVIDSGVLPDGGSARDASVPTEDSSPMMEDATSIDTGQLWDGPPYEYVDAGFTQNLGQDASVTLPDGGSTLGTYLGYFENYMFPSGSDAVLMKLALGSDGITVTGIVVLGSGTPPPPPTQPDVGYPTPTTGGTSLIEGYAHTVLSGNLMAGRLRLGIDTDEPWAEWCQIQTSYPQVVPSGGYSCIPAACGTVSGSTCSYNACLANGMPGPLVPIDCAQESLCGFGLCTCTASGCSLPLQEEISFDMQLTAGELTGSARPLPMVQGDIDVVLMKQ